MNRTLTMAKALRIPMAILVAWATASGATPVVHDPPPDGWLLLGNMPQVRVGHSATLLGTGQILVVGGVIKAAEGRNVLLVTSTVVRRTTDANEARWHHTANGLTNGSVLVAGGSDPSSGVFFSSAEIYNPRARTWTFTGSMSQPRAFQSSTGLLDGRILVAGGVDGAAALATPTAEIYDPVTGVWSATASMTTPRLKHSATLLQDGRVLVVGGELGDGQTFYSSAELYDPSTGRWSTTGSLGFSGDPTAALLQDGDVLVVVKYYAQLYDAGLGQFRTIAQPIHNSGSERATLLDDGRVLVEGGTDLRGHYLDASQTYDPATDTWSFAGTLPVGVIDHTATRVPGGTVIMTGGQTTGGRAVATDQWFLPD